MTNCFRVDGRMIAFGFGVVESPDATSSPTIIVDKPVMIMNPNCNNIRFK
jgi:hypothetical protein